MPCSTEPSDQSTQRQDHRITGAFDSLIMRGDLAIAIVDIGFLGKFTVNVLGAY